MAVLARYLSTSNKEREQASKLLHGPKIKIQTNKEAFIKEVHDALYSSRICTYAQGLSLLAAASKEYNWNLNLPEMTRIWQGGCIIRAGILENIRFSFDNNPHLSNLLLDAYFNQKIADMSINWRKAIAFAVENGIPVAGISSACAYYDGYRCANLPTSLIQAQRDFFGAHTYKRIDKDGSFHTEWESKKRKGEGEGETETERDGEKEGERDNPARYKLGVVGTGHWVRRLHPSIERSKKITLHKGAGTTNYEDKKELLDNYRITKDTYFQIKPTADIPAEFFKDLDVVQIASYNQFHHSQTKMALEHGRATIVEKAIATERKSFEELMDFIIKKGYDKMVYPHLHYLSKALSRTIPQILPEAIKKYGKIKYASATFFEEVREEDIRRTWLLKPENGGIFLDWIHPVELLVKICGANFQECYTAEPYIVNAAYDVVNPTAVCARFKIAGEMFSKDATATIRVGKGFPPGHTHKTLRLVFEKNAYVDFNYISSEEEFETGSRGTWELAEFSGDKKTIVMKGAPKGPLSYDFLVLHMHDINEGKTLPLTMDDIKRIYEPVWQFHEASKNIIPKGDKQSVEQLLKDGVELAK